MTDLQHKYFKFTQKRQELETFSKEKDKDTYSTGIIALNEYFKLKIGFPLFIAGNPFAGKSEFTLELLVNTSKLYGWKHCCYFGEGGNIENIFYDIFHKWNGNRYEYATETERIHVGMLIEEHFVIINHDFDFTIDEFYNEVSEIERVEGIRFTTTTFDPFNDFKDELSNYGGREDKYLADALKKVRISSKVNKRIDILVNHIADVKRIKDDGSGMFYTPPALPNEWAGGRTWWRRAFTMILVYRYPSFIKCEDGSERKQNETTIIIQKSKPKGVGKNGQVNIYYDWYKSQYYSIIDGQNVYSCEKVKDNVLPITEDFF